MEDQFSEFDAPDFDPITYINSKFIDEASLKNLDAHISSLNNYLGNVDQEVMTAIQEHALLNLDIQKKVSESNKNIENLVQDVISIKEKAQSSEALVTEMCKDIKSLDIAKKNLSFSITAIRKYVMMSDAVEKLREYCEQREYKEVSNLISAIEDFFLYFKKYESVSQIQSLYKEKETILTELKAQIKEDFIAFGTGHCDFKANTLQEACILAETIGLSFRDEIVNLMCQVVMKPYEEFKKPENANLESVERRYAWIQRRLKEIETLYENAFPTYWGIKCSIYNYFCGITRIQLEEILGNDKNKVDHILSGLVATAKFENKTIQELEKEYGPYIEEARSEHLKNIPQKSKEFAITTLPRLKGSISTSFENYMGPYIDQEFTEMQDTVKKALDNENYDAESDVKVLDSSLAMFNIFKTVLKKTSQYSKTNVMYEIFESIQDIMKFYCEEVTERISKNEKSKNKDKDKDEFLEVQACMVVNTGDYCKEILSAVAETVKQYLDVSFHDKVDFGDQEQNFINLLNKGLETLVGLVDSKTDGPFAAINKTNWDKLTEVGDTSEYVKEINKFISAHVRNVASIINDKYYVSYLNKIVDLFYNKFTTNLYKLKKISDLGVQRLQVDVSELKSLLVGLIKIGMEVNKNTNTIIQTTFATYVNKKMNKIENILKLLGMNNEQFMQNLKNFFEDENSQDVEKLMIMKGIKKSDYSNFLKIFSSK